MSIGRGALAALLVVLGVDLAGVLTVTAFAAGLFHPEVDDGRSLDAVLVATCAIVGFVTWLLAVVAIASVVGRRRPPGESRIRAARTARRWIWAGLVINTVGSLGVAIAAAVAPANGSRDGSEPELSTAFVVAMVLALAGAVVSLAYLLLLRFGTRPHDAPARAQRR